MSTINLFFDVTNLSIPSIVFLILVIPLITYFLVVWLHTNYKFRMFKGPTIVPVLGNLYTLKALTFITFLVDLRRKYGKVFTLSTFTKTFIVVCDPIIVRRILIDTKTFPKDEIYTYYFNYTFGDGLVTSIGEKHKKDRVLFGKYFIRSNIIKFTEQMNATTDLAITEFAGKFGEGVVNIEDFFATLAIRVFITYLTSKDYFAGDRATETKLCHMVSKGSYFVAVCIYLGIPMWKIFPVVNQLNQSVEFIFAVCMAALKERREILARGEGAEIDDLLSVMIRENMSDKDCCDHFITLLSAGHDTTAYFASYTCFLLAENPEAQEKLYEEIKAVTGDSETVTADHFASMKYMQKVMQETLRLYAVIPTLSRCATEDVHIPEAKMTIPKGTALLLPLYLINRDPELWPNPSKFDPERFEGSGNDFTSARSGFFPFGFGTRTCIGNTLAQIESSVFLVKLLRKYRIEPDVGFRPRIAAGISLTTENGINVRLVKRETM